MANTWRAAFETVQPYIVKITSPQGSGTSRRRNKAAAAKK
jgi:pantothenate kinase-related protein Tda10